MLYGEGQLCLSIDGIRNLEASLQIQELLNDTNKRNYLNYAELMSYWDKDHFIHLILKNKNSDKLEEIVLRELVRNRVDNFNSEIKVARGGNLHLYLTNLLGNEEMYDADFAFELLSMNNLI